MTVDSEEIDADSYDDYGYDNRDNYSDCIHHLANSEIIIYKLSSFKSYHNLSPNTIIA
jgi:hypothetical protein